MDDYWKGAVNAPGGAMGNIRTRPPEFKTLRDEFAMAALTGVMESIGSANPKIVAEESYAIADAMMKAREQEKTMSTDTL